MLKCGLAVLVLDADVARRPDGRPLLNGLFAMPRTKGRQRLICDKRPSSAGERRLQWARLPYGPMLARVVLRPGYALRASGDDLSNYFYLLHDHPEYLQCVRPFTEW